MGDNKMNGETIKVKNKKTGEILTIRRKVGTVEKAPALPSRLLARTKRAGAIAAKGVLGDIPFVRKALPPSIKTIEPYFGYEKLIGLGAELGRDISLLKGIGKLGLGRTALRGAGIGMLTAGAEEPKKILEKGAIGAFALPVIKKGANIASRFVSAAALKGLKTTQQAWQDLIRAGFMVEKSTVERVQRKGIQSFFNKKLGYRDSDAFLKLGNKIFRSAMKLRRHWGGVVGRWRNQLFKNERIRVSVKNPRAAFQSELKSPLVNLIDDLNNPRIPIEIGSDTTANRLLEVNELLKADDVLKPKTIYNLIGKLDDLYKRLRGTNEGRIINNLTRQLKEQVYKSAPTHIRKGLRATETKFSDVADATDDIFDKLPLRKEGVALKERIGATERSLARGLQAKTPAEERVIYERLDKLLPTSEKFMELYKNIFAAQDLQREGIGWLLRRLFLAPRMAAFGLSMAQKAVTRPTGAILKTAGKTAETIIPPLLLRRLIQQQGK